MCHTIQYDTKQYWKKKLQLIWFGWLGGWLVRWLKFGQCVFERNKQKKNNPHFQHQQNLLISEKRKMKTWITHTVFDKYAQNRWFWEKNECEKNTATKSCNECLLDRITTETGCTELKNLTSNNEQNFMRETWHTRNARIRRYCAVKFVFAFYDCTTQNSIHWFAAHFSRFSVCFSVFIYRFSFSSLVRSLYLCAFRCVYTYDMLRS